MSLIKRVSVLGLNGSSTVHITLQGQHCILVGPNGSGKSTFLSILACALGRQWRRLSNIRFEELEIEFSDNKKARISREACDQFNRALTSLSHAYPLRATRSQQYEQLSLLFTHSVSDKASLERISSRLKLPTAQIRQMSQYVNALFDKQSASQVTLFEETLKAEKRPPIVYLPTYRRIELELKRLFEGNPEAQRVLPDLTTGMSSEFVVEMIRFGMEDISQALQSFERDTRDFARNRFNRMMTSYLKEMANASSLSVRDLRSRNINQETIDTVLSRIEEGLLNQQEKARIADTILALTGNSSSGNPPFTQKWLAHFFVRLMEVHNDIESRESPMRTLVKALNKYFLPSKEVFYDSERYHFGVRSLVDGSEVALSELSSGEKQVVSILSHLHFSQIGVADVLIDEPELSLSVPWQTDLLMDVAAAPACNQIFAVTHSPFIYDNSLQHLAVDFVSNKAVL